MADSAVHVEGVVKRFGTTQALAGVDLDVEEATVFGLLGPNGAGKTTLVHVIATLLAADDGHITVCGSGRGPAAGASTAATSGSPVSMRRLTSCWPGRENLELIGRLYGLRR